MARVAGVYNSGNIPAAGSGNEDLLYQRIRTELTAFQSNGANAWQEFDVLADGVGNRDIIFHSVGDRALGAGALIGDTDIFFRMRLSTGTFYFRVYRDWSDTSHTGDGGTTEDTWTTTDTDEIDWYRVGNAYEFVMVILQGGDVGYLTVGRLLSRNSTGSAGIGRISIATTTTGAVVVDLDRDISASIRPGQAIWLHNRTPIGQALKANDCEIATVSAVTATTITLTGVAAQPYEIGALVGMDPAPVGLLAQYAGAVSAAAGHEYTTTPQADVTTGVTATHKAELPFSGTEGDVDPASWGDYLAMRPWVECNESGKDWPRGELEHQLVFSKGANVTLDRMIVNNDPSLAFKYFTNISFASYGLGIGPGAT